MAALLLAAAIFAAPPLPSKVLTVKVSTSKDITGSMVVSAAVPSDSRLFLDEQEVLATINTIIQGSKLCQLGMNTILTRTK